MAVMYEGMASVGSVEDSIIHKAVRQDFSEQDANNFVAAAAHYEARLAEEGFLLPQTHGYDVIPNINGRYNIVQHTEFIQGHHLADNELAADARLAAQQQALGIIAHAATDSRGFLRVAVDAKPENFVVDDRGAVFMVDVLPPLVLPGEGRFPYEHIQYGETLLGRRWVDHYVRSRTGALTRFAANALRLSGGVASTLAAGIRGTHLDELFQSVGAIEKERVRHKIIPLLGATVERRVNDRFHAHGHGTAA